VPAPKISILDFFDNHVWDGTYPTTSIIEAIVRSVRLVQPFAVFSFFPDPMWGLDPKAGYDDMGFHPDHQFVGKAVASSVAGYSVSDLSIYNASFGPPWSPSELWFWKFQFPTFCLRLSQEALNAKIHGFLQHKSQYSNATELTEWVTGFSRLIGSNCGFGDSTLAEGFQRYF
jgi:LmbE family N-acetylglucosaminyl deacetylase